MKNIYKAIIAAFTVAITVATFGIQSFAYSAIPDYFDFGACTVNINAGSYADVWLKSNYKYTCYLGPHTSSATYIDFSGNPGSEYVRLHIGPDETQQNVMFYFYVRDDAVADQGIYDGIEVYVQNIDYDYARRADQAAYLKWYAYNNSEFNAYDYYMNYADMRNAFGLDGNALYNHYYTTGKYEHRVANRLI